MVSVQVISLLVVCCLGNFAPCASAKGKKCRGFPFGVQPFPRDCTKYQECIKGRLRVERCPGNTVFNEDISNCDAPANVPDCNSKNGKSFTTRVTKPEITSPKPIRTTSTRTDETDLCRQRPNGLYPHPRDCSSFIQCSNRITYTTTCNGVLKFNAITKVCDYPQNVECG